jgi:hypothetical protein
VKGDLALMKSDERRYGQTILNFGIINIHQSLSELNKELGFS